MKEEEKQLHADRGKEEITEMIIMKRYEDSVSPAIITYCARRIT